MEQINLKSEMIDYIAEENRACFKLQQIDDPAITLDERKQILNETLEKSHSKFLLRFGPYMKPKHSAFFENGQNYTLDEQYQVEFYLNLIKRKTGSDVTVKNRRYEAMKRMIEEGQYFSEIEMMKREPLLYHEFVGQYLTQSDIQKRDSDNNKSFLNLIFATVDHNAAKELKRKQENEILEQDESLSLEYEADDCPKTTSLWGEFEENLPEQQYKAKFPRDVASITNEQRYFLRSEFLNIMHSKFLSGSDKDFDYAEVDFNQNYDNLEIIARDEEDKYFDSEDADESTIHQDTSEDDDLDRFMKTLNKSLT